MIPQPLPKSCFPVPCSSALLLGDGEGLLYLNFPAVVDGDIFKRFIPAICLSALDLPHHILVGNKQKHIIKIA